MAQKLFKFYSSESGEYKELFDLVLSSDTDASSSVNRAKQYSIPTAITTDKTGKLLKNFLHTQYRTYKNELKNAIKFAKKFDKEYGEDIKARLESVFEYKIPQYNVRLNVQMAGTSDWVGTNISIYAFCYLFKLNSEHNMRLCLVWETTLSQTFIAIRKKYSKQQISDKKVWAIAELTAVTIWKSEFSEYDWGNVNVGYAELAPYQNKVLKLYKQRKNFDSYLDSAVKLFKNITIK